MTDIHALVKSYREGICTLEVVCDALIERDQGKYEPVVAFLSLLGVSKLRDGGWCSTIRTPLFGALSPWYEVGDRPERYISPDEESALRYLKARVCDYIERVLRLS